MLGRCCCLLLGSVLIVAAGCAMCDRCDDYSYTGSGGRWERLDPCFGRVGSAFTPEVGTCAGEYGVEEGEHYESSPESGPESTPEGEPTPAEDPAPEPPGDKDAPQAETSVLQNRETFER